MDSNSIKYIDLITDIRPEQISNGFFEGWATPLTSDEHYSLLSRAGYFVVAVDHNSVIGFVTVLSDGMLTAYIPLLEVLPQYRHRGIGSELIKAVTKRFQGLYMIDVLCDENVLPFYESLGFTTVSGVCLRNFRWRETPTPSA